ncbi:MAG: ARC6/PARC6 family protein, partial [bacterium]
RRRRKASNNNIVRRLLESQTNFLRNLDPRTRLVWLVFLSLGSLLVLWLLASTSFNLIKNILFPSPSLQGQQLAIQLNESPINIPDPNSQPEPTDEELTKETAQEVIESWLSAKAAALGSSYQIDGLNQILTGPALLQWQSVVEEEQKQEKYRQYKHSVEVLSVSKKGIDEN